MTPLKVLFIAGWYPSKKNPVTGVFVKEHAKAVSLYNDVVMLYSEGVDRFVRGIYHIDDNMEDGLRTLHLRYRKSPRREAVLELQAYYSVTLYQVAYKLRKIFTATKYFHGGWIEEPIQ